MARRTKEETLGLIVKHYEEMKDNGTVTEDFVQGVKLGIEIAKKPSLHLAKAWLK